MGFGAFLYSLGAIKLYDQSRDFLVKIGSLGSTRVRLAVGANAQSVGAGGVTAISAPAVSPAFLGVGYIIGPRLAALNFAAELWPGVCWCRC